MNTQRLDTSDAPHVRLTHCAGDVQIGSWQRQGVEMRGTAYSATMTQADEIIIEAETAVSLLLPPHSRLTIGRVAGNLTIKHVAGLTGVEAVSGDLTLHNVGSVQVAQVGGQVHGEGLDGALKLTAVAGNITLRNTHDVTIQQAGGDLNLQFVNGDVALGEIEGDLTVRTVSGALHATRVGGTARLRNLGGALLLPQAQGAVHLLGGLVQGEHLLSGAGDLFLYWPGRAPLSLTAEGRQIVNRLKLQDVTETAVSAQATRLTGYLADHKTALRLHTTARIALLPWNGREEPGEADENVFVPEPEAERAQESESRARATQEEKGEVWETAVARGVAEVLLSIELEFGPEWKHRFAALELEKRLIAAIHAELHRLTPTAQATSQPTHPAQPTSQPHQPAKPSSLATFHKAEQAVEKSLLQAEESMDVTRRRIGRLEDDEA